MKYCPNCGKEVSEDTGFCPECGCTLAIGQGVKAGQGYLGQQALPYGDR